MAAYKDDKPSPGDHRMILTTLPRRSKIGKDALKAMCIGRDHGYTDKPYYRFLLKDCSVILAYYDSHAVANSLGCFVESYFSFLKKLLE